MSEEYRYRVRHRTAYDYTGRIDLCHSVAHLRPREEGDQEVLSHRVDVSPEPHFQVDREDYYDNGTLYFEIQGSHEHLEVVSSLILAAGWPGMTWPSGLNHQTQRNRDCISLTFCSLREPALASLRLMLFFSRPSPLGKTAWNSSRS